MSNARATSPDGHADCGYTTATSDTYRYIFHFRLAWVNRKLKFKSVPDPKIYECFKNV